MIRRPTRPLHSDGLLRRPPVTGKALEGIFDMGQAGRIKDLEGAVRYPSDR